MNITKTELPTRPFTVKKFKLECEGKEYIVVEYQYYSTIESLVYGQDWQNSKLELIHNLHYGTRHTHEELIYVWRNTNPVSLGLDVWAKEGVHWDNKTIKLDFMSGVTVKHKPDLFDENKPLPPTPPKPRIIKYPSLFDIQWLSTLLQRIKNLFKKKL